MNIHEYVAKKIFRVSNIKIPESYLASSPEEAAEKRHRNAERPGNRG